MMKHTLRVSDNRMLPTILGMGDEVTDERRTLHRGGQNKEMGRVCGTSGGTGEVHTGFWWGDLKESDH